MGIDDLEVDSFDYEEQIVAKMEADKPKDVKLTYRFGDCTDLSGVYQDAQFQVAVDKGTLDAIAVDDREETVNKCKAYFNEMIRILDDKNGVLLIVSLLQPHVLKIIFDFFIRKNSENKYQEAYVFQMKI